MTTIKRQPAQDIGPVSDTQSVQARPLEKRMPVRSKSVGRPAKLEMPAMPALSMTDAEQEIFDFFVDAYNQEYPDLTPTDQLMLHLAAVEYVKYLRVAREELETGKVITMSRQHPGVQMRALLDQLSVTRKARTAAGRKPDESEDEKELKDWLMSMSSRPPKRPS